MTNTQAVNGLNLGYGMDPVFLQYYMSQANNTNGITNTTNTNGAQATTTVKNDNEVSFRAIPPVEEPKKGNSTAKLVVGTALTVGAALLCRKAYIKGGSGGFLERIGKGFKAMWNGMFNKADDVAKGLTAQQNKAGEWYCTVPDRVQNIKAADAARFDISTAVPRLGSEGTKAKAFKFVHDGNEFFVKDGKITKYINNKGDDLLKTFTELSDDATKAYKEQIEGIITKLQKGEQVKDVTLKQMLYTHEANGVTRTFRTDKTQQLRR